MRNLQADLSTATAMQNRTNKLAAHGCGSCSVCVVGKKKNTYGAAASQHEGSPRKFVIAGRLYPL